MRAMASQRTARFWSAKIRWLSSRMTSSSGRSGVGVNPVHSSSLFCWPRQYMTCSIASSIFGESCRSTYQSACDISAGLELPDWPSANQTTTLPVETAEMTRFSSSRDLPMPVPPQMKPPQAEPSEALLVPPFSHSRHVYSPSPSA